MALWRPASIMAVPQTPAPPGPLAAPFLAPSPLLPQILPPPDPLSLAPSDPAPAASAPVRHHFDLAKLIDAVTLAPLSHLYGALPHPIRNGVHNVLVNLDEPDVAVNDLLQLHPGRAAQAAFRFATNTTFGVAGIFDVAKHLGAHHHDNDAATTLAYYRIGDGPKFHIPLIETDNVREAAGFAIDFIIDPVGWGQFKNADTVYASQMVMDAVDSRVEEVPTVEYASAAPSAPSLTSTGGAR
jgi:phospholipid-binding lipoprotein MlaA